ncbi:MAG: iron-sulfur cluster assembly protein [Bacteroidota bacterium]|jgi:FeS assembly SUF system protein
MITIENPTPIQQEIIARLKYIYDPEIPVNIWELGFIYEINQDAENNVRIVMTLTAPNCPVADTLPATVRDEMMTIREIKSVNVEVTFDPPWDTEMMSEAAMLDMGLL